MKVKSYCAVYDFELLPYALGDVLTWNVQTALRCEEAGRDQVDAYICMDPRHPANIYQRGLVVPENCGLFFNELFGAFGTHPRLGNIFLFTEREQLLERLRDVASEDPVNAEVLSDYERVLTSRDDEEVLKTYFIKYIYSHDRINEFAAKQGHVPLLRPSAGCEPDVIGLLSKVFPDKKAVVIHPRLRRLDSGYGGEHTHARDSDFLEWYGFIRLAEKRHPDVQFFVLGRLQEKPLALLNMPNVVSLRTMGLGLGHELTLMLHSDLFIGTSSGFAAMVNFSTIPYFITKMNDESYNAYRIAQGSDRLPFATEDQVLISEPETTDMLMGLLERGLGGTTGKPGLPRKERKQGVDVRNFGRDQAEWLHEGATASRFFTDEIHANQETAFLLWPKVESGLRAFKKGRSDRARAVAQRVQEHFPHLSGKFPELDTLIAALKGKATKDMVAEILKAPPVEISTRFNRGATWLWALPRRVWRSAKRGTLRRDIARTFQRAMPGFEPQ